MIHRVSCVSAVQRFIFNLPQNVGERLNIHSKILKKPFHICFQLREKVVILTILFSTFTLIS